MNFKDAVGIGLGLDLHDDGTVTPKPNIERVICHDCRADYLTALWSDKVGCKWCNSSNVDTIEKES